jgi:ribosomal protein S18 acetylase RimI-like enzyme
MIDAIEVRPTRPDDVDTLLSLYRAVAQTPGGLARLASEISRDVIESYVTRTIDGGVGLVAVADEGNIDGEIHALPHGIFCFSHVLTDLTIAVHPDAQSKGIGRRLFESLMQEVARRRPEISRVELIARESNRRALGFYESLGFVREGILQQRIRNPDGSLESDVPMAWLRDAKHREQAG